jgi:hypothetical protein
MNRPRSLENGVKIKFLSTEDVGRFAGKRSKFAARGGAMQTWRQAAAVLAGGKRGTDRFEAEGHSGV